MLAWAAALEKGSEHPLAHAVVEVAEARKLVVPPVQDFNSETGASVAMALSSVSVITNALRLRRSGP